MFQVKGMGSVAGAPYLSMYAATDLAIIEETLLLAAEGLIDNPDNIRHESIYIFQGLLDTIVPWGKSLFRKSQILISNIF